MVIVSGADGGSWTFLTNYARVLIHIARKPSVRLRDIAATSASPNAPVGTSWLTSSRPATSP